MAVQLALGMIIISASAVFLSIRICRIYQCAVRLPVLSLVILVMDWALINVSPASRMLVRTQAQIYASAQCSTHTALETASILGPVRLLVTFAVDLLLITA